MKQTFLTLITTLVFAGAGAYLLQKVRRLENRLVRIRQLALQRTEVGDVHQIANQIAKSIVHQREKQLKFETAEAESIQRAALQKEQQQQRGTTRTTVYIYIYIYIYII